MKDRLAIFISTIDPNICFECGGNVQEMHHVVPVVRGGSRVIPLCESCHGKVHSLEREGHSLLIKEGLQKRRNQGKRVGATPYGFRANVDGKIVEDEKEQITIQKALKLREKNLVIREIINELASQGHYNRAGHPFTLAAMHKILKMGL